MSLDLGELSATIKIDSSRAERDLQAFQKSINAFDKALGQIENKKLNLTPSGRAELEKARSSVAQLKSALGGVGGSIKNVDIASPIASQLKKWWGVLAYLTLTAPAVLRYFPRNDLITRKGQE